MDAFWDNLLANREGIRHFAPHELDPSVPQEIRSRPNFVAARGVLEDADRFDATFFGISAREATVLDPQQRLFLELCWTALEHASIDPSQSHDRFGVYAGVANNTYTPAMRQENPELVKRLGEFGVMLAARKTCRHPCGESSEPQRPRAQHPHRLLYLAGGCYPGVAWRPAASAMSHWRAA